MLLSKVLKVHQYFGDMYVYHLRNVSSNININTSAIILLTNVTVYNWCEVKTKMWLLKLGQPVNITVLNEAASIELGANLLGETVIFTIAAGVLLFEYNRYAL